MKFWAKAIWAHLKSFLADILICLGVVAVTFVLGTLAVVAIGALVAGFVCLFGLDALLITMIAAMGLTILWGILCAARNTYKRVKETKERLEEMENV